MSTITASTFNANDTNLELEPLRFMFGPVGARDFGIESVFRTSVAMAANLAEQRAILQSRPYLRLPVRCWAKGRNERMALNHMLARMAQRRFLAPLFCDESPVTGNLSATGTTITCVTDYRRFFVGGRVAVYKRSVGGEWPEYEVVTIGTVGAGSLTVSALSGSYTAPIFVAPLVECELLADPGRSYALYEQSTVDLIARGLAGKMAIPAISTFGTTPGSWGDGEYDGYPIFNARRHMTADGEAGQLREGEVLDVGFGSLPDMLGDRARGTWSIPLEFIGRDDAWAYLEFAHSRAGRAHPFWLVTPDEDFTLVSTGTITDEIRVEPCFPLDDWVEYLTHIAIVETDGTVAVLDLADATVTEDSGDHLITLDEALSPGIAAADIERVSVCRLARYADDVVDENWTVLNRSDFPDVLRSEMRAIELLNEKTVAIEGLEAIETEGLEDAWTPEECGDFAPFSPAEGCEPCGGYYFDPDSTVTISIVVTSSTVGGVGVVIEDTYPFEGVNSNVASWVEESSRSVAFRCLLDQWFAEDVPNTDTENGHFLITYEIQGDQNGGSDSVSILISNEDTQTNGTGTATINITVNNNSDCEEDAE